jgi:integrase
MSYQRVADGIYQDSRTGAFYERPHIQGRRTWRRLDGHTIKLARESFAQRRADATRSKLGLARNPYAAKLRTVAQLILAYTEAGYPTAKGAARHPDQNRNVRGRLAHLAPFWGHKTEADIDAKADCHRYFTSRKGPNGEPAPAVAVNYEVLSLSTLFEWALTNGLATANPLKNRPRLARPKIRHCREVAPQTADELHALAAHLFDNPQSAPLGWQLLLEALTGCRTAEILALRWDAKSREAAGYIEGDWLWLQRRKGGVNPFAAIHPDLRECLTALRAWHAKLGRFASPWFIPSLRIAGQPIRPNSLTKALSSAAPRVVGHDVTSHGLRSFYVTARRSQGVIDAQIAAEIGDRTGPSIIAQTYGDIPPNWKAGGKPILWTPAEAEPAWARFLPTPKVMGMPEGMQPCLKVV